MMLHNQIRFIFLSVLLGIYTSNSFAQTLNKEIFDFNIKTVLTYNQTDKLSFPAIGLQTGEKIEISFDDLNQEQSDYIYTLIHCNSDWKPSGLPQNEYIKQMGDLYFETPKTSINTRIHYNHFSVTIPNESISILVSGNYIFRAVNEQTGAKVFDTRFIVYENEAQCTFDIKRPDKVMLMDEYQEVNFSIQSPLFTSYDPFTEMQITLLQNARWDNALTTLHPRYIKGDAVMFDNDEKNIFLGGNEFRQLHSKTLTYKTEHIADILYESGTYTIRMKPDEIRRYKTYKLYEDIDGASFISYNAEEGGEYLADYTSVQFSLPCEAPDIEGDIYLQGALTNWDLNNDSKIEYNYETKAYEKTLLVKQGYHDYHYVLVRPGTSVGDSRHIEGSFYETQNTYQLIVYLRDKMQHYDRAIGFATAKSYSSK